jgi:hypothetical protein
MNCELSPGLVNIIRTLSISESSPHLLQACRALEQTALVAGFLKKNGHEAQFWKGGMEATRVLGPAAHYALLIPRMAPKDSAATYTGAEVLCEMVRLALLILIAGMKKAFSLIAGEMAILQQKFWDILPLIPEAFGTCPELELWSMVVVACTHSQVRPHVMTNRIKDAMARMSINTATQAIEVASSIIWVDAVMDIEARSLILDIAMATLNDCT